MPNSKIWDVYDKNCWFYERVKLSYFAFKNGQGTGTEFIALWRQFVCSGFFTPCFWGEIQRLKGQCHAIWQLYKNLEGVFASIEFQN